jgi:hypothetical protein
MNLRLVGITGCLPALLLFVNAVRTDAFPMPQAAPSTTTGWYNGDWQSGLPGQPNWFISGSDLSRVFDDFVVPAGGWTVVAVFSNNRMNFSGVTKASWEIRTQMAPGKGGRKVASGTSRATQTPIEGQGPFREDPMAGYRIQVDGLHVHLEPGRYWLSVAPVVGLKSLSYINSTLGKNAIGTPAGSNGGALVQKSEFHMRYAEATKSSQADDFSQGVIISGLSARP